MSTGGGEFSVFSCSSTKLWEVTERAKKKKIQGLAGVADGMCSFSIYPSIRHNFHVSYVYVKDSGRSIKNLRIYCIYRPICSPLTMHIADEKSVGYCLAHKKGL